MKSRIRLLYVLGLLGAVSASWAAGESRVRDIVVTNAGPGEIDTSLVTAYTSLRVGDDLDRQRVSGDVRKLIDSGRFTDASVTAEPLPNGVRLIYTVRPKWKLAGPVDVKGVDHFRISKIRDFLDLHPGDMVDEQSVAAGVKKVQREYREDFYPDVETAWVLLPTDTTQGLAQVNLTVHEGKRAKVRRLQFDGNKGISDRELKHVVRPVTWYNPFSWFKRVHYDPQQLEELRESLVKEYRNRGYLDVDVATPAVERDAEGQVQLIFQVIEGVQYHLGRVTVGGSGLAVFPQENFPGLLKYKPGDLASEETIRQQSGTLRDYFGARGYIQTSVRPRLATNPTNATVDVTYSITEGHLTKIRNIMIRGNTRTKDKVIRREVLVYPGEIYNEVKVRQSERVLNNLGYFSTVRSDPLDTRIPDEKDLAFTLEEKRTGQFMVGAGFSSVDQLIGFTEISQGNFDISHWPFTGGGQKIKARAQVGSKRDEYQISFVEPWFLNRKLSLGVDLYRTDVNYSDYDESRLGAAVSLGKALPGPNRIQFQYRIEQRNVNNVDDTNEYFYVDDPSQSYYFTEVDNNVKSSLGVTLTHDTRNNPFVPTRGDRASIGADVSGGPLGFDTENYELTGSATHYQPLWFKHVLSLRTRWQVVDGYGGDEVNISDRLFMGGGRTVRGYKYRNVGPKVSRVDPEDGDLITRPVGGQSLGLASAEYSIPIVSALRLATFYDIGNVWQDPYEFDFDTLASGAGVGIRFDLPGFPIRIDRAWSIEKDNDLTRTDSWTFWIGFE
ncbi:MAG: outer membrane protein assembly factor BamA [Lentisphaerae bacterium]|nr:outer membrane protein assembly factor BamA [Lentisphaerota bacterium]